MRAAAVDAGVQPARPIPAPGAPISNLRGLAAPGGGAAGLGALGFLAAPAGARDWSQLFLVSNRHVLFAHGAGAGDAIFQPRYRSAEGRLLFDSDPRPVATLAEGGFEGHWRFAYPGESERSWFVDCAAAALVGGRGRAGAPAGPVLFASVARASPLDALPGREIAVYKLGRDRAPSGKLVATDATVSLADGTCRHNNLVIRGLRGADGKRRPFAVAGDSGALVLDRLNRAVGLLWGVNLEDPGEAYACHIHPVLDCLKLAPWRRALRPVADGAAHD
jgi:hypothetical protein